MKIKETVINAKSALIKEQIEDRINKGAKSLEIQLLNEFKNNEKINLDLIENVDINVIHMPLVDWEDCDIETVEGQEYFKKVCKLASEIGKLKGHNIIIVIHISTSLKTLRRLGIENNVINVIKEGIDKYQNIEIAIENTVWFGYSGSKMTLQHRDPFYIENNELKMSNIELAEKINHERCGVCFDTCHAIMSEYHLNYVNQLFEGIVENTCNSKRIFDMMFEQSAPLLKLIHLAYTEKHGYNEYHGLPFTDKESSTLKHIDELYNKYNVNCPITIEVYEKNYNDAVNYTVTMNEINKI